MPHTQLRLIAAPFTPMDAAMRPDPARVPEQAERLRKLGVWGAFVCGTTGEGMSLTMQERYTLAEAWRKAAGNLHLTIHVGHSSVEEARDLAQHAAEIGADDISSAGPTFFPSNTISSLVDYCARIADAAPRTPFHYYHIPSMVRVGVKGSDAMAAMMKQIPTFTGMKFTHDDLDDYARCIELAGDRADVFFGRDELLLEALRRGARAAIGSTYNFAAPLYLQIGEAFHSGDIARAEKLQSLATQAIDLMVRAGGMPAIKAIMATTGFDCGPVRLPLETPDAITMATLRENLDRIGYFAALRTA